MFIIIEKPLYEKENKNWKKCETFSKSSLLCLICRILLKRELPVQEKPWDSRLFTEIHDHITEKHDT